MLRRLVAFALLSAFAVWQGPRTKEERKDGKGGKRARTTGEVTQRKILPGRMSLKKITAG